MRPTQLICSKLHMKVECLVFLTSLWPKATHGFFMHPPLLKSTAGGRRKNRMKSALEGGTRTKGRGKQHECPICHQLGHHWYKCKNGDPNDIAAMEAER